MTYKDSTDDGEDASVAGDGPTRPVGRVRPGAEADAIKARLQFMTTLAKLWRNRGRRTCGRAATPEHHRHLAGWLTTARRLHAGLVRFLERRAVDPRCRTRSAGRRHDRVRPPPRREGHLLDLGVEACVVTTRATFALSAILVQGGELAGGRVPGVRPTSSSRPPWEGLFVRVERAIGQGHASRVAGLLPRFVSLFRNEPLLYCPPSDGGKPRDVLRAQTAPERPRRPAHATAAPRADPRDVPPDQARPADGVETSPPEGRRVSSFDQLFRTGLVGVGRNDRVRRRRIG